MKKFLLFVLTATLMLSLSACGKSEAAKAVDDQITAIGEVTLASSEDIKAAQAAYDALSAENQAKITNASALESAAAQLKTLKQAETEALLSTMHVEVDKVRGLSFYYPNAFPYYTNYWGTDIRCFALPYLGKEGDRVWVRLVCDYTGDDWIFFKKITFAIDDQRYTKAFNYFDIVRDNAYGDVWEYIDIDASTSNYMDILQEIADSTETIIRFEGDNYHYDLTVKDSDKQAIREVLTVYEALS